MTKDEAGAAGDLQELGKLFSDPVKVEISGETVEVRPLTIRQTGKVAGILREIFAKRAQDPRELDIAELVGSHTEHMVEIVAVATGRPAEWVANLRTDHFVDLAELVFRVNGAFFVQCVAPRLAGVARAMAGLGAGAGPTSAPTSSNTDTPTPAA